MHLWISIHKFDFEFEHLQIHLLQKLFQIYFMISLSCSYASGFSWTSALSALIYFLNKGPEKAVKNMNFGS